MSARRRRKSKKERPPQGFPLSTLCWCCEKYAGGCNWSDHFLPVEGWEATPTVIKEGINTYTRVHSGQIEVTQRISHSYKVHSCPEFVQDIAPHELGLPRNKPKEPNTPPGFTLPKTEVQIKDKIEQCRIRFKGL